MCLGAGIEAMPITLTCGFPNKIFAGITTLIEQKTGGHPLFTNRLARDWVNAARHYQAKLTLDAEKIFRQIYYLEMPESVWHEPAQESNC